MNNIRLVMKAAISNNLRRRDVLIVCAGVVFICVIGVAAIFTTQFIHPQVIAVAPDRLVLENFLGLILFTTSIISIGVYASVFSFQSIVREKSRGNIQALLATPLAPGDIWLGKSLAAFLPGLMLAELMTLAVFLIINTIYIIPEVGLIVTPWMVISSFIAVPLVYFTLTLLVHVVGLTSKPATANVIAQIFLPVIITVMINLAVRNIPSAASWLFTVILLGVAAIFGAVVLMIRSKITTERMVMSG
jgi:ABC-type Na+ efflux pump permease subunit